ncbi:unnamed protein product [Arctogadus glacialis]
MRGRGGRVVLMRAELRGGMPVDLTLDPNTAQQTTSLCSEDNRKVTWLERTSRIRITQSRFDSLAQVLVVCHATGFFPDRVVVFWRRDGQELHEQVDPGEVLPNHDGTFQVSVDLDLTAVPQEDWGRYECVVQLKGIEDIPTPLDPALIRTNWGKSGRDGGLPGAFLVAGSVAGALLLVGALVLAGVCWYRKRNDSAKRPAAGSDTSSEIPEGQKRLLAPTPDPKS